MVDAKSLGTMGELKAIDYLEEKGYTIKDINYRNKLGEIDIVGEKDRYIVFIEVKTRRGLKYGRPVESIGYRKMQKIRSVAELYIQSRKTYDRQPRFDVVEVLVKGLELEINHIENAF